VNQNVFINIDVSPNQPVSVLFEVPAGGRVSANITVTFTETNTVRVMQNVMLGGSFSPNQRFLARSCDSLNLGFRESIIDQFRTAANNSSDNSNTPLFTIGDAIYADRGFVKPSGVDKDFRAQYARAWVDTFDALSDVTASQPNIHLADDHELWDNFDMQMVSSTPHLQAGLTLMREIYEAFMGPFRRSAACTPRAGPIETVCPYDTYSFQSGKTCFAMVGKGLASPETPAYVRSLRQESHSDLRLVVMCGNAAIQVGSNWMLEVYYFVTGKRGAKAEREGGASWKELHLLAEDESMFQGGVQLVAGDMHAHLRENYGSVDLVVTSPFCNQTMPTSSPLIDKRWTAHRVPNFAEIEGSVVVFHEQPVPFFKWLWSGIVLIFKAMFIFE